MLKEGCKLCGQCLRGHSNPKIDVAANLLDAPEGRQARGLLA